MDAEDLTRFFSMWLVGVDEDGIGSRESLGNRGKQIPMATWEGDESGSVEGVANR